MERVQKIIANRGYCSRRKAEELIIQGRVSVNGKPITIGDKASPDDKIMIDNRPIPPGNKKAYLLLNKPRGYITTLDDPKKRRTINDLLKENNIKERLIPVGRLDKESEGALLLTNDGDFANRVMHPRYEVKKSYEVTCQEKISDDSLKKFREGIIIDGKRTSPALVKRISPNKFLITIHEGRNRIIRKMVESEKGFVKRLVRVAIGPVKLKGLKPGRIRPLTTAEIRGLTGFNKRSIIFNKNNMNKIKMINKTK